MLGFLTTTCDGPMMSKRAAGTHLHEDLGDAAERLLVDGFGGRPGHLAERAVALRDPAWQA